RKLFAGFGFISGIRGNKAPHKFLPRQWGDSLSSFLLTYPELVLVIPLTAVSGYFKSFLRRDLNNPPTTVGGIPGPLGKFRGRKHLKEPPTAVGGIASGGKSLKPQKAQERHCLVLCLCGYFAAIYCKAETTSSYRPCLYRLYLYLSSSCPVERFRGR